MLSYIENQLSNPIFLIQLSPWYSLKQLGGNGLYFMKLQFPSSIPNTLENAPRDKSHRQQQAEQGALESKKFYKYSIEENPLKLDQKEGSICMQNLKYLSLVISTWLNACLCCKALQLCNISLEIAHSLPTVTQG